MNCKRLFSTIFLVTIVSFFFAGCATGPTGPRFTQIPIPSEKSVIYFYAIEPSGATFGNKFAIHIDGQKIADLHEPNYIAYIATPGKHQIKIDMIPKGPFIFAADPWQDNSVTMDCETGKAQYVHVGVRFGMEWVRNDTGESEITQCRLQN